MAIHIHIHRKVADKAPFRKPNFGIGDIAIGGTVIYKEGSSWRMSKAVSTSGMNIKLATGKTISVGDVWSTDASDWNSFRNATADKTPCGCKNKTADASKAEILSDIAEAQSKLDRVKSCIASGDLPTACAAANNLSRIAAGIASDIGGMK